MCVGCKRLGCCAALPLALPPLCDRLGAGAVSAVVPGLCTGALLVVVVSCTGDGGRGAGLPSPSAPPSPSGAAEGLAGVGGAPSSTAWPWSASMSSASTSSGLSSAYSSSLRSLSLCSTVSLCRAAAASPGYTPPTGKLGGGSTIMPLCMYLRRRMGGAALPNPCSATSTSPCSLSSTHALLSASSTCSCVSALLWRARTCAAACCSAE